MPLLVVLLALLSCATHGANAAACDPTTGFVTVPLTDAQLPVQRPYDVPLDQRYELANGMRRMWVYCTDKPHSPTSHTKPRTEIRTVFGAAKHATTLMLHVYGGALVYYNDWTRVVDRGIYNRWFRLNVIHDVGGAGTLTVFIDGQERLRVAGRGGDLHYFKFGVYTQTAPSHLMESRWRDVRLFTKEAY
ncbi:hypothetical protein CFC21_111168 [Triticum aestivum]|uniref:Alginate lyase 2 domain-containing protein n=2 Tax=Triticum aestivum TaxID=4565 RepID=A0A9R1MPK9_WHEAT|nr:hypothetical protein CFC21_111168 [Triticum aestivum]